MSYRLVIGLVLLILVVRCGGDPYGLRPYIDDLEDADPEVRARAAYELGEIGFPAKGAIPNFIAALDDEDRLVRKAAALALPKIGRVAIPALIATLKDGDVAARRGAATALGGMGRDGRQAVPVLRARLEDFDEDLLVRYNAALALGPLGRFAEEAVPTLIARLEDATDHEAIRDAAAFALGRIGPKPRVVPALNGALNDDHGDVRFRAAITLRDLGPTKETFRILLGLLVGADSDKRRFAADWLGQLRAPAQAAVPALISSLEDEDARVRRSAANALPALGPAAKEAIPALEAAAREGVPNAEDALYQIRRR